MKKQFCLLILLLAAHWATAQPNKAQDDSLIRASRAKTNDLIADHDIRGLARYYLHDYVRISGTGIISIGKDSAVAYWAKSFKDHPTISYVRIPTEIIISDNGVLAWESGTWTGINTKSKGGTYAAMWSKQDNIWKLQSELYVTLTFY